MRLFSSALSPLRLIGIAALVYVFQIVDVTAVMAQMRAIGPASVAAAAGAFAALVLIRCFRWRVLVQSIGKSIPMRDAVSACNASIWLGMATPARVGEFRRGVDLARRTDGDLSQATALVVFDLLLDLGAYLVAALAGAAFLYTGRGTEGLALYAVTVGAGLLCLVFLRVLLSASIRLLPGLRVIPGVGALLTSLVANLFLRRAVVIAVTTLAAFFAYASMMGLLVAPMHLNVGPLEIATIVGVAGVAGAIPVTYFGIGTREFALIWYLDQLGFGKETAVAVSFSFLLAQLIGIGVSLALTLVLRPERQSGATAAAPSPSGRPAEDR
jgi:uncharacterized membrane protein YbhN (UPF0104 family)